MSDRYAVVYQGKFLGDGPGSWDPLKLAAILGSRGFTVFLPAAPQEWEMSGGMGYTIRQVAVVNEEPPWTHVRGDFVDDASVEPPTRTYALVPREVAEVRAQLIGELKAAANTRLQATDWYVTRQAETGQAIPDDVAEARTAIREFVDLTEAAINQASLAELGPMRPIVWPGDETPVEEGA